MMTTDNFFTRPTIPPFPPDKAAKELPEALPAKIGPYQVETLLSKGGMSILYLATHPESQDTIAIKVLSPKYLSHPEMTKRFLNEAEIIALADHPNIIKLYGYGEWEAGLYIAMEFIQGISLRQYLLQNPLSLKRSLEITLEIAYALCHLHTHGVIHRDLKLENILVTEAGHVKVIDFGIAQLMDPRMKNAGDLSKKQFVGTPIYMSPEQVENPENVSYPSDIYSLGIIAYELVLGKLSHGKIHLSLMPKGLQKILNKALQPKIEERYQDIVDFISDLSTYLHSSNLEKEGKASDQVGEIFEKLQEFQFKITSKETPDWSFADFGYVQHRPAGISSIYLDFFHLVDEKYAILLAEPGETGAEGLMCISYLKGLIKGLGEREDNLIEDLSTINHRLIRDEIGPFAFSYLLLQPENNQLTYISCGCGPLWIIPKGKAPQAIISSNIALGIEEQYTFQSCTSAWNRGDLVLLAPLAAIETIFTLEQFEHFLHESQEQTPQKLVESVLRKAKNNQPKYLEEHPAAIVSLLRNH